MTIRVLLLIVALLFTLCDTSSAQYDRERNSRFIVSQGDEMPHFSCTTLDGDQLDSDFLRGQVVLLQFVASWCPYSKAQMDDIEAQLWQRYSGTTDLMIIGLSEDIPQDTAEFRQIVAEKGITYPMAFDIDESIYRLFATPRGSVTRTVIFNRDGRIIALFDEHDRRTFRHLRKCIEAELLQAK